MSNLVLYRKYRPKSFNEVVGQEHVVQTLKNAVSRDLVSHAYLFSGPRGSGKTTLARIFAKTLNCTDSKGADSCNKCFSCNEVNQNRAMDLIEIDAASNRGIEDIKELREGIKFAPTSSKYKVLIIDECHQLSRDAANALLKVLEEPPSHAIFILATTEIHKMISTILSRCQRFDFRKLTVPEMSGKLREISDKEKIRIGKDALDFIALNSSGSMRDAESMLGQVISFSAALQKENIEAADIKGLLGMVDMSTVSQFVDYISEKKPEAISFLNSVLDKGYDSQEFARSLISYLRQVMLLKIGSVGSPQDNPEFSNPLLAGFTKEEQEKLQQQAARFTEDGLRNTLHLFLEAENRMKYSPIPQLPLELVVVQLLNLKEN